MTATDAPTASQNEPRAPTNQVNGTNELILRSTTPDSGQMRQDSRRQADALVALHGSMRLEVGPRSDAVPGANTESDAAVAAYRLSVQAGNPLSERKLAQMFGRTSRRWARARITETWKSP